MPFWQYFRMGWDGRALLVWPSRIPHRNQKNIFVLGSYESLERLKCKIGEAHLFKVQSGKITVWAISLVRDLHNFNKCIYGKPEPTERVPHFVAKFPTESPMPFRSFFVSLFVIEQKSQMH